MSAGSSAGHGACTETRVDETVAAVLDEPGQAVLQAPPPPPPPAVSAPEEVAANAEESALRSLRSGGRAAASGEGAPGEKALGEAKRPQQHTYATRRVERKET